jgi:hypothetical protein
MTDSLHSSPLVGEAVRSALRDAARYRWLRDHGHTLSPDDNFKPFCCRVSQTEPHHENGLLTGAELDEAIDAELELEGAA